MNDINAILSADVKPALLIGNGINRFSGDENSSWDNLLRILAARRDLRLDDKGVLEMSNTEVFDILDLASAAQNRSNLQKDFCNNLAHWLPDTHHKSIVTWAVRHERPIITVNFDENLSKSIDAQYYFKKAGFTDYYPWASYFSNSTITNARSNFAIWHAHGMQRYHRSIRLGLTHYMGSVHRARERIYGKDGLLSKNFVNYAQWQGSETWLDAFFFAPIAIMGFGFSKDETFFRWLFLERARFHKLHPSVKQKAWFIDVKSEDQRQPSAFLTGLGIEHIKLDSYEALYNAKAWEL